MPESNPSRKMEIKVEPRSFRDKLIRMITETVGKELAAPICAAILATGATIGTNEAIKKFEYIPSISKIDENISITKEQIRIIRERQKKMGGPIPEWWDRVIVNGNITSSVNALEVKLKTLEAKKSAVQNTSEAIKPYWDLLLFGIFFTFSIGFVRSIIQGILDSQNTNWREKSIVESANSSLQVLAGEIDEIKTKMDAINTKLETILSDTEQAKNHVTELSTLKTQIEALSLEFDGKLKRLDTIIPILEQNLE